VYRPQTKVLPVTISQVLEETDETIGRLQNEQRTTRGKYIDPMDKLTSLDPYHGSCARTGRDNGGNIGCRRVENAKASTVAQTLCNLPLIAQQSQLTLATSQDEHARMSADVDV
jgi:hypothetical protein